MVVPPSERKALEGKKSAQYRLIGMQAETQCPREISDFRIGHDNQSKARIL